ncbi:MAG: hypothetical protein IJX36_09670 [Thermoguttaceae bacterium]|nr:hypothetical protein [Thermoguttaceae bacterium]MBQ9126506.1 hypothetical protein [Thermoguttaceae bacterium]
MTAPNDDRFNSFLEEYRRFADAFQNAGVCVSDNFIAKIVKICPNASDSFIAKIVDLYQSVSDQFNAEAVARKEFDDLTRGSKKRRVKRRFEILLKRVLEFLSLQESKNASPLSALSSLRTQFTPPSRFERFAIERRRKPVASSKIRKAGLAFKRRPRVRRRTLGR